MAEGQGSVTGSPGISAERSSSSAICVPQAWGVVGACVADVGSGNHIDGDAGNACAQSLGDALRDLTGGPVLLAVLTRIFTMMARFS